MRDISSWCKDYHPKTKADNVDATTLAQTHYPTIQYTNEVWYMLEHHHAR